MVFFIWSTLLLKRTKMPAAKNKSTNVVVGEGCKIKEGTLTLARLSGATLT
jgi:hypothetical protein